MQDGSLSNKANPFLAGLTGLGEGLFQGFLTRKKMDEEQRQFNEKMAMEERQNSLMNMFKQKDYELNLMQEQRLSRPPEKKAFLDSYKEGYTTEGEGGLPVFHPFDNKSVEQPEYTTTTVPDSKTGKEKTYSHIKDTEFGSSSWKLIGDKPIYKPETAKTEKEPDVVDDYAELESVIEETKSLKAPPQELAKTGFLGIGFLAKNEQGYEVEDEKGNIKQYSPEEFRLNFIEPTKKKGTKVATKLMLKSGIANAISGVKQYIKSGVPIDRAIDLIIKDNKHLAEEQQRALRKYFEWANL